MKINKGETYGAFLKRVRLKAKLTQTELALRLGYHPATICAWENGRNIPPFTQRVIDKFALNLK